MNKRARRENATGRGAAMWLQLPLITVAVGALTLDAQAMPPPASGPQLPPRISADLVYTVAAEGPAGSGGAAALSQLRRARIVGESVDALQLVSVDTLANLTPTMPGGLIRAADGSLLIAGSGNAALSFDSETGIITPRQVCENADVDPEHLPAIRDLCADGSLDRAWAIADRPMVAGLTLSPQYRTGRATPLDGDDDNITSLAFTSIYENHQPYQRVFYAAAIPSLAPGGEPIRCLGFLSTLTGATVRLMVDLPAARALAHDAFTGDVMLAGGRFLAQVDAHAITPQLVSYIDLGAVLPDGMSLDLVDITTDGRGRVFAISADGRLVVLDYADSAGDPESVRIGDAGTQLAMLALEPAAAPDTDPASVPTVRGLLPLSGPGAVGPAADDCLWDNGEADGFNGQLSQVNTEQGNPETADDVYLCPGRVYRLDTLTATLASNSVFPKAKLEIYDDCNGAPANLIATFDSFDLTPTGQIIDEQYTVYTVRFMLGGLHLDGGRDGRAIWISVRGVGLGVGLEEWFWQTSGEGVIKGRSGMFRSGAHGHPDWTPIDGFGCGCSDFAFRLYGHSCKVLIDGGPPDIFAEPAGVLSQIASDADTARVADDFVIPPCDDPQTICYVRAYVFSNCTPVRGQFELYEDACGEPDTGPGHPVYRAAFERVTDLSYSVQIAGETMTLYCVEAFGLDWPLLPGRNYWLAPVGDTNFSLRKRSYAVFGRHCDASLGSAGAACLSRFSAAKVNGRGVNLTRWTDIIDNVGRPRDLAMVIAIEHVETPRLYDPTEACPADMNRDGVLGLADLFDYLTAWFTGCP